MSAQPWQIVRLTDVAPTPWRNGGGVTRELVAWPNAQAWTWRISVAEVASDGPFSRFDGVQRWLAILRGAGVRLGFGDRSVDLTAQSAPLSFAGVDPVDCRLLAGPVQDLNLMVRGGTGRMRRVSGSLRDVADVATTVAIYNLAMPATALADGESILIPGAALAWRTLPAGARIEIHAERAIWMEITA